MADPRRRLIVLALGASALVGCDRGRDGAPSFKAVDITGAAYARGFDLPDFDGHRRHLADFKGRVVVVFFGYTQCADVCPTTLTELAGVRKALGEDGQRVQIVFITLDPERDTPELLKDYLGNFGGDVLGLRGSAEETRVVATQFKVYFAKVPGTAPGSYTIDHSAGSYVFDTQGRVRLFAANGPAAEASLEHDLRLLLSARS